MVYLLANDTGAHRRTASKERNMADQTYELNEDGAPMDYPQHEETYSMFLLLTKWGILFNVALLLALAVGFFMGGGLVGGTLVFIVLMIVAKILA